MIPQIFIHNNEQITDNKFVNINNITYSVGDKFGSIKQWEKVSTMDSVHVLVYNTTSDELLLIKQPRIPVLVNTPSISNGETFELCAGIIDGFSEYSDNPHLRALHIAKQEVREELGHDIPISKFEPLPTYIGSTGLTGSTCYPFYVETSHGTFRGQKLEESEFIDIIPIKSSELSVFLENTINIDASTRYLLYWWLFTHKS